jgi:hypothetical protein
MPISVTHRATWAGSRSSGLPSASMTSADPLLLETERPRGLSNNGTASGDGELKTAGLPRLAVRISKRVLAAEPQDLPAGSHEDGDGG